MKAKIKRLLFGFELFDGLLFTVLIYVLLISIGFVFLLPVAKMLSTSFKDLSDIIDPTVGIMPSKFYTENYEKALKILAYDKNLLITFYVTLVPAVLQTASAAIIGYGFARFKFPLKNTLFMFSLITFIIPASVTSIPKYLMFRDLGILGDIYTLALPAITGQGLKSAIFILIFYQFFKMVPKSLEEAAQLDGANHYKIFFKIAIPMAVPAFIVSFIFSFVWYWNETYTTGLYLGGGLTTLPLELEKFAATFKILYPGADVTAAKLNEGIKMAGTILSIVPLLIVYFVLQHWFVEGVDRTGITGE